MAVADVCLFVFPTPPPPGTQKSGGGKKAIDGEGEPEKIFPSRAGTLLKNSYQGTDLKHVIPFQPTWIVFW